jgi:hypothetical protein
MSLITLLERLFGRIASFFPVSATRAPAARLEGPFRDSFTEISKRVAMILHQMSQWMSGEKPSDTVSLTHNLIEYLDEEFARLSKERAPGDQKTYEIDDFFFATHTLKEIVLELELIEMRLRDLS